MTARRPTVTDALIARALAERANGPDVDLMRMIMTATSVTPQRRGWLIGIGPRRRAVMLVLAAALAASLIAVGIVGSNVLRPRVVDGPLLGNGPITAAGMGQIVEFDALTGEKHPGALASTPPWGLVEGLDWSRDGARLAISTDQDVSIYDAATGKTRSLIPCGACTAIWSPDGTGLTIVDASGGNRRGPVADTFDVISMIDPDDGRKISRIDQGERPSSEPDSGYPDRVQGVSWSPDGHRLAVSGLDAVHSTARLVVMDRDGTKVRPISLPTSGRLIVDASWSPEGSTIAYIGFGLPDQDSTMSIQLALVDPDGVKPSRTFDVGRCFCLGFSPSLTWSPDGRMIAFTSIGGDGDGLHLAKADGSDIRLTTADAIGPLAWRPIPPPAPK